MRDIQIQMVWREMETRGKDVHVVGIKQPSLVHEKFCFVAVIYFIF